MQLSVGFSKRGGCLKHLVLFYHSFIAQSHYLIIGLIMSVLVRNLKKVCHLRGVKYVRKLSFSSRGPIFAKMYKKLNNQIVQRSAGLLMR